VTLGRSHLQSRVQPWSVFHRRTCCELPGRWSPEGGRALRILSAYAQIFVRAIVESDLGGKSLPRKRAMIWRI